MDQLCLSYYDVSWPILYGWPCLDSTSTRCQHVSANVVSRYDLHAADNRLVSAERDAESAGLLHGVSVVPSNALDGIPIPHTMLLSIWPAHG